MGEAGVDAQQLSQLFSVWVFFDSGWTIERSSEVLRKYVTAAIPGARLDALFTVHRPNGVRDTRALRDNLGRLFLLVAHDGSFAMRGQVLQRGPAERGCFQFLGAPWLAWISSNRPDITLSIADFSKQDAQLDQLFLLATEQNMVADLTRLTDELSQARDRAEAASKAKSAFYAVMNHEMRTPLNGIVGALTLLGDEAPSPRQAELLAIARSAARELLTSVNTALDAAKAEAVEPTVFALETSLSEVLDVARAKAEVLGVSLFHDLAPGTPSFVSGDEVKLRQILLNLVSNAIKFTSRGHVCVRVSSSPSRERSARFRFEVEDTGRGIPRADQDKVFSPYWSSKLGGAHNEVGTGLGLDIVRRLVEMLGGEVGFSSVEGEGTTFWFEVPLTPTEAPSVKDIDAGEDLQLRRYRGRVLLVDDNRTNRMVGKALVRQFGLVVDTADDGQQALVRLQQQRYELVLMDISMPVMDGVEATVQLRKASVHGARPVVALTAHAQEEERARILAAGLDDYLTKPLDRAALAAVLARWLTHSHRAEEPVRS